MNKKTKGFILTTIALIHFSIGKAQTKDSVAVKTDTSEEVKKAPKSYFKFGASYISNSVYSGRKDSAIVSYLEPSIGYYDKSGFNISASASYLTSGNVHRIDAFSLSAGYDFKIMENWEASIGADRSFYNDSTSNVEGGNKGTISADMSYDFDIIQLGTSGSMMFGTSTEYGGGLSISHAFSFGKEDTSSFSITPTIKSSYGTQGFFNQLTRKRIAKKKLPPNTKGSVVTDIIGGSKAFSVLDYEFSLPITYEAKDWAISLTPTYAIPLNPTTTTTSTKIFKNGVQQGPTVIDITKEDLSNSFYFELEFSWKF